MKAKFDNIISQLSNKYYDRYDVIRGMLIGLLAEEDVFILGPPGTAKSAMIKDFAKCIDGKFFSHLLTKFSTPEELFGPLSIAQLKRDIYEHVPTNTIQDCNVAFLDEVFKANSSILNSLLEVQSDRIYSDGGKIKSLPLSLLIGASNELPESKDLEACYDRYLLRFYVDYLDHGNWAKLMSDAVVGQTPIVQCVTLSDIAAAKIEVEKVTVDATTMVTLGKIRQGLKASGFTASDRRWYRIIGMLKASAWIMGNSMVTDDDFDILSDIIWSTPSERIEVTKVIMKQASPVRAKVNDIVDRCIQLHQDLPQYDVAKSKIFTSDGKEIDDNSLLSHITKAVQEMKNAHSSLKTMDTMNPHVTNGMNLVKEYLGKTNQQLTAFMGVTV